MKPEEKEAKKVYDNAADYYHYGRTKKYPQGWFYNELLEMPATLELLGNVKGKKILDFGCGTGIYAKLLTKKGAIVKGFDISEEMLKIAKKENPKLDLKIGSGYKIPFNEKFDIILASLVVHYLKDWNKMLREIKRVLKPNGLFIFSTGNPVCEVRERINYKGRKFRTFGDYFNERKIYGIWRNFNGKDLKVASYHITYETLIRRILSNGFEIIGYKDCFPLKKAKKLFPEEYKDSLKTIHFCVWKVRKK